MHPCLFRAYYSLDRYIVECCKAGSVCLFFGHMNPLVGYKVILEEYLISFIVSPTFILGIWHRGDWMR